MNSLFLRFGVGDNLFAMGTAEIEEVLPALIWTPVPHASDRAAGFFGYRGEHVPLIDLSELMSGHPANIRMSTRIILIRHRPSGRLLGLLAEHVTETFRASETEFKESGITNSSAPYLGRIIQRNDEVLQHFVVNRLMESALSEGIVDLDLHSHN